MKLYKILLSATLVGMVAPPAYSRPSNEKSDKSESKGGRGDSDRGGDKGGGGGRGGDRGGDKGGGGGRGGDRGGDKGGGRGGDRGGNKGGDKGGGRGGDRGGNKGGDKGGGRGGDRDGHKGGDRGGHKGGDKDKGRDHDKGRGKDKGRDKDRGHDKDRHDHDHNHNHGHRGGYHRYRSPIWRSGYTYDSTTRDYYYDSYTDSGSSGGYYDDDGDYVESSGSASCSPAAKVKGVNAVEAKVGQLLATDNFDSAITLKKEFSEIRGLKNVEAKIAAYCDLVGVDVNSPQEVAEFLGARDHSAYVRTAQNQLKITNEQAKILVNNISQTLLNGVNR